MLKALTPGDVVIVTRIDRLAFDLFAIIKRIADAKAQFQSLAEPSIVRTGNIASMPEEAVDLGSSGSQEVYLVESRSIGGLSGSPVFLSTPPVRFVRGEAVFTEGHHTEYLIGINIGLFQTNGHLE